VRNQLKYKSDTIRRLSTSSFEKDRIQQTGFSKVKMNRRQIWLQSAICRVGENGQIGKTVWKINPKQNETAAISKVKPSILKQIQIKLMVDKSVFIDINIHLCSKEGVSDRKDGKSGKGIL
jgi:hypothetical protein